MFDISLPLENEGCQWTAYTQFSWPANTDSKETAYDVSASTTNQRKTHFFLKAKKDQVISAIISKNNQVLSTSTNISKVYWHRTAPWNPTLPQVLSTRLMVTGQCIASERSLRILGELSSSIEVNALNWHYAYSYAYLHLQMTENTSIKILQTISPMQASDVTVLKQLVKWP